MKLSLAKKCMCIVPPGMRTTNALVNAHALALMAKHDDPIIRATAMAILERDCPLHPRGRMS